MRPPGHSVSPKRHVGAVRCREHGRLIPDSRDACLRLRAIVRHESLRLEAVQSIASELEGRVANRDVVLIVEDDAVTARSISRLVRSIGLIPRVAPNAREALDALSITRELRALVTDLQLPDGNGLWIAEAARRQAAALPIVILTGTNSNQVINQAFRVGAQYLCKPLDAQDVASLRLYLLGAPPQPVVERVGQWAREKGLDPVDHELLTLALAGFGLPSIAERLEMSEEDLQARVVALLPKLGARDLGEVVRLLRQITAFVPH
jgi:CheY-like chemotaxis protein